MAVGRAVNVNDECTLCLCVERNNALLTNELGDGLQAQVRIDGLGEKLIAPCFHGHNAVGVDGNTAEGGRKELRNHKNAEKRCFISRKV